MAVLIKRRRIEILAFERQRITTNHLQMLCPVCQLHSEFLTASQACSFAQVKPQSIYRWLMSGKVHGIKTAGGGHRICGNSLFRPGPASHSQGTQPEHPLFLHSD